ncbi:hypothetical protein J6590_067521 [Homalodisca vitripennis]|nr:hypothetical protein J6590_067521 [Homalodisca vitripennis]
MKMAPISRILASPGPQERSNRPRTSTCRQDGVFKRIAGDMGPHFAEDGSDVFGLALICNLPTKDLYHNWRGNLEKLKTYRRFPFCFGLPQNRPGNSVFFVTTEITKGA